MKCFSDLSFSDLSFYNLKAAWNAVNTNWSDILGSYNCKFSRLNYLFFSGWYSISNNENMFMYLL